MRRLVLFAVYLLAPSVAAGQPTYGILPLDPNSAERMASIEALRSKGPALAGAFKAHTGRGPKGEQMPYRLFTPSRLEAGRTYPLVVFLHGAGGSGTDNLRQLQGANVFGALVWTLPENQQRHPAFVLAPQSDVNWPCTIYDPKNPPKTLADIEYCPPEALGLGAGLAFQIIDRLRDPAHRSGAHLRHRPLNGRRWRLAMIAQRPRLGSRAGVLPTSRHGQGGEGRSYLELPWGCRWSRAWPRARDDQALRKVGGRPRHTEHAGVGTTCSCGPTPSRAHRMAVRAQTVTADADLDGQIGGLLGRSCFTSLLNCAPAPSMIEGDILGREQE
jgi:hypothetical protein